MENHKNIEKEMRSTKMGKMENEKNREILWLKITHLEDDIANEEWTKDPANLFCKIVITFKLPQTCHQPHQNLWKSNESL